jgi:hypothetical protein
MATITITDSYLEGKGSSDGTNNVISGRACKSVNVANSTLVAIEGTAQPSSAIKTNRYTKITNTQIISPSIDFDPSLGNTLNIATSLIQGGLSSFTDLNNVKLVNDYDENLNPIPNHQ